MRVTIRGVTYGTVREAAKAHGVSEGYVYQALSEGRQDSIGIGMGKWRKPHHRAFDGNKIVLYGVEFPSMTAASLALGFNEHYIRGALRRPSKKSETRIREAVAIYERKTEG
jgi:hypothetical protein